MRAKLKAVNDQLRRRMHQPIPEQGRWLASVVRGHIAYYAVPGNTRRWRPSAPGDPALAESAAAPQPEDRLDWKRMGRIAPDGYRPPA